MYVLDTRHTKMKTQDFIAHYKKINISRCIFHKLGYEASGDKVSANVVRRTSEDLPFFDVALQTSGMVQVFSMLLVKHREYLHKSLHGFSRKETIK